MPDHFLRHEDRYLRYGMVILLIVLSVLVVFLFFAYRSLRRAEILNSRAALHLAAGRHRVPLWSGDVGVIQSWMTFDYVNYLFALPSSTLKNGLGITNPHYPHITLQAYAGDDIDTAKVISEVQNTIRNYDAASSTNLNVTTTVPAAVK